MRGEITVRFRLIKPVCIILSVITVAVGCTVCAGAVQSEMPVEINAKSAILVDVSSGQVLAAKNEHERLFPASVTKIMTLLVIFDELAAIKKRKVE